MSITGTNEASTTYSTTPFYSLTPVNRKKAEHIKLFSEQFDIFFRTKTQDDDGAKVMAIINEDKDCPKGVDRYNMTQMILKVAKEFDMDPVILACILRKETHFNHVNGKNGQGLMQLTKISIKDMFQRPNIYDKKLDEIKKKYPTTEMLYEAIKTDPELNLKVGTILFKAKYEAANGNLAKALENYNGSPLKKSYSKHIMDMINSYA